MTEKEKEQQTTQGEEEHQPEAHGQDATPAVPDNPTAQNPSVALTRVDENPAKPEEDPGEYFLRMHSSKKVRRFWYVPNLKNSRLRDILQVRLPYEHDPIKILFNAPKLRKFFPVSTFKICLNTRRVYTFTELCNDIGVGCQPDPFDIDELKIHFRS